LPPTPVWLLTQELLLQVWLELQQVVPHAVVPVPQDETQAPFEQTGVAPEQTRPQMPQLLMS
jgi:hypothetical protein